MLHTIEPHMIGVRTFSVVASVSLWRVDVLVAFCGSAVNTVGNTEYGWHLAGVRCVPN